MRRFLCLHGSGTSNLILEIQLAPIISLLEREVEFEFYQGSEECQPAPHIEDIFPSHNYFEHYNYEDISSVSQAQYNLIQYAEENGPYDGVIGFSQGAALAAAVILRRERERELYMLPDQNLFRCAILICGSLPVVIDERGFTLRGYAGLTQPNLITIPTVHVVGEKDELWKEEGLILHSLCDPDCARLAVYASGHEVPRTPGATKTIVNSIRWALQRADWAQTA